MRFIPFLSLLSFAAAAPVLAPREKSEIIPGKYIVVLKPESEQPAFSHILDLFGDGLDYKYEIGTFKGLSGSLTETLLTSVKNLASVSASPYL